MWGKKKRDRRRERKTVKKVGKDKMESSYADERGLLASFPRGFFFLRAKKKTISSKKIKKSSNGERNSKNLNCMVKRTPTFFVSRLRTFLFFFLRLLFLLRHTIKCTSETKRQLFCCFSVKSKRHQVTSPYQAHSLSYLGF